MKEESILTVGSFTALPSALPSEAECDVVEVRLEADMPAAELEGYLTDCPLPKLLTARDIREGGARELSLEARGELLHQYKQHAQYIDIELENWDATQGLREELRAGGCCMISSYHDFTKTPTKKELGELLSRSLDGGADIMKFAFMLNGLEDLGRLQELLLENADQPLAVMGMGSYAPVSRVLLAQCGSMLNYGYLGDTPTAPGQWRAALLKAAIAESPRILEAR